ncbi:oxygenase MpaB family protein [Agromyces mediolanus]|uniref:oxygenase MpaB family protein n=1 Tax=Agromyces mediolanus TaxID=41986 RepID=UPI0038367C80
MAQDETEVFRRHAADASLLVGGAAAILLQLADPRVAAGVARHSDFADRPFDRLLGTLDYLYTIGFGSPELAERMARRVDERHRPVHGRSAPDGTRYSAFDPDAPRWVAATIAAVTLELHERLAGPLPPAEADVLVRRLGALGGQLQATSAGWPETRAEFDAWWTARVAGLEVGDDARAVARALFEARVLPGPLRLLLPPVRLVTVALLPAAIRTGYGLSSDPRVLRAGDGWLRVVAIVRRLLPRTVLELPLRQSLRRAERVTGVR